MAKQFSASTSIEASAYTVWQILTNGSEYTEWDANMISLTGTIAQGEKLTIYTKLAPKRAFNVTVSTFEPARKMIWQSGMPLGLFSGVRTFLLVETSEYQTKFTLTEEFSGLLLPVFGGSIPDMNPIFAEFCEALKNRAESM